MITRVKHRALGSLCALFFVLILTVPAAAADLHTLTIRYDWEGVCFHLYQTGTPDGDGWTLTGQFSGYSVKLPEQGDSAEIWRDTASTLAAYAALDGLTSEDTQATRNGEIRFSNLANGLYLAVGENHTHGDCTYIPVPILIAVEDHLTVQIKSEEETTPPGGGDDDVSYRVVKIWEGGEDRRTQSVTVQLLCNGQPYHTATLNDTNNWSYSWTGDPGYTWQVAELEVPEGFVVSVSREDCLFTVTNRYQEEIPDEPPPEGDRPHDGPSEPNLPQTGQLWWPVPVLLCAGVAFLIADRIFSRRKDDSNDT